MQNGNAQKVTEPDFQKNNFPAENAVNMPEKPVFRHFLEISSLVFSDFFAPRCVLAIFKTWLSPIFEKNFFPAENTGNMPELAIFADFHWTFFLYVVVFSLKNIINNNAHHQAWFNCH